MYFICSYKLERLWCMMWSWIYISLHCTLIIHLNLDVSLLVYIINGLISFLDFHSWCCGKQFTTLNKINCLKLDSLISHVNVNSLTLIIILHATMFRLKMLVVCLINDRQIKYMYGWIHAVFLSMLPDPNWIL